MRVTMNIILLYWLLGMCSINCNSHSTGKTEKTISITFNIDGKLMPIANRFTLQFIKGRDTLTGQVTDTTIQLPNLKDSLYDVQFKYASNTLFFPGMNTNTIIPNQNIKWKFGIQNRPFNIESGLLSKSDYENDTTTKYIIYWQFDPEEFGDGIQIVEKKRE
jgi:hypothetical protein